jgi:branched-chain amino acid transport system substrate-binding protein
MSHARSLKPAGQPFRSWARCVLALAACCVVSTTARADIVIGQVAPFSGPQAVTGKAIHAGVKLYIDAVNERGGVKGQRIRLVTRDDAQKPDETVRLVKELIAQESPVALIGTVGTSNLEAVGKDGVLAREHISMVGAVSGAASVARTQGMLVVKASYHDEVRRLFSQLSQLGLTRVGLVYQDDGLGKDVLAGAEQFARQHGIVLVAKAGYERNTTNVQAAVDAMHKAAPQAIFLGATTAAAIEFVKAFGADRSTTIYGLSIIDTEVLMKKLGPQQSVGYAFSVVLPLPTDEKVPLVREYLAMRARSGDPDLATRSLEGFIAAKALVRALERTPRPTRETVAATLHGLADVDLGGYHLDFTEAGRTRSRYVDFAIVGSRGKIVK